MAPVTLVVDPQDSATCATAVSELACLPHGRVVCHPTPGGSHTWLGCDLLLALGKRFDALLAEHVRIRAWELTAVWLQAEAVEHLFVIRAHTLKVGALQRLHALQQRTGVHLCLVSARAELTAAQRQVFGEVNLEKLSADVCVRHWQQMARACRAAHVRRLAEAYPLVPPADFTVFRAVCRWVLDPASFAIVDRTFTAALADTLTWLATQRELREHFRSLELDLEELDQKIPRTRYILDRQVRVHTELNRGWYRFQTEASNQLNTLTASTGSPSETLRGTAEFGAPFNVDLATRLRGLCTPGLAGAAALALALQLGPHALASLRVGEIAPSGTALELHGGERRVVPAHASALVRAQLIHRRPGRLRCRRSLLPAGWDALPRRLAGPDLAVLRASRG
jgi:hypothetical protein